jgi:hypothetical protein
MQVVVFFVFLLLALIPIRYLIPRVRYLSKIKFTKDLYIAFATFVVGLILSFSVF